MTDDFALGLRLKCLELVAAAVATGRVLPREAYGLAHAYLDFLTDAPVCDCDCDDDEPEVSPEVVAAAAAKRRH
jgi:hypothetical protein